MRGSSVRDFETWILWSADSSRRKRGQMSIIILAFWLSIISFDATGSARRLWCPRASILNSDASRYVFRCGCRCRVTVLLANQSSTFQAHLVWGTGRESDVRGMNSQATPTKGQLFNRDSANQRSLVPLRRTGCAFSSIAGADCWIQIASVIYKCIEGWQFYEHCWWTGIDDRLSNFWSSNSLFMD